MPDQDPGPPNSHIPAEEPHPTPVDPTRTVRYQADQDPSSITQEQSTPGEKQDKDKDKPTGSRQPHSCAECSFDCCSA